MKLKTVWLALSISLLICVGATAKPASQKLVPAAQAQINAFNILFRAGSQAVLRRDVIYLGNHLAPNFTIRASGVVMNRAQYLSHTTAFYKKIVKMSSATSEIKSLGFRNNRAYVTATNTHDLMLRDRKRKLHLLKITDRLKSVWIRAQQSWIVESAVQTSVRVFVDGHEVKVKKSSTR